MGDSYDEIDGDDREYDRCYIAGQYDGQYCPLCPHRFNCSGYEEED